jgi:hypothetical protein
VDHAGLKLLLHLFQIESRSKEKQSGLILILLHRFLSLAREMMVAMEEKLTMLYNGCTPTKLQMRHAPFTKLEVTITESLAVNNSFATTVNQMVKTEVHAGLRMTTKFI